MEIRSTYAIASRNLGFSFRFFLLMWSEKKIFYPTLDTRRGSSPPSPPAAAARARAGWTESIGMSLMKMKWLNPKTNEKTRWKRRGEQRRRENNLEICSEENCFRWRENPQSTQERKCEFLWRRNFSSYVELDLRNGAYLIRAKSTHTPCEA